MNLAMIRLYCGESGKAGYYNLQEVGLAKALVKRGIYIYIFLLDAGLKDKKEENLYNGLQIVHIPAIKIENHGLFNCRELLHYHIDVVHLQSDNQVFAPSVMRFCKKHDIYCYNYVGTLYSDSNNKAKKLLMDAFSKHNLYYFKKFPTFVKTPAVKKQIEQEGISNVQVMPVGLDEDLIPEIFDSKLILRERLHLPVNKKILIFVGRLEKYKKPLEAIKLINELSDNYFLVMIGKGSLKESIFQEVESLNIGNKILYIESVPNCEIHQYYKASDYFVNFNDKEIFGMSILEAMYQGCVVVAVDAPGPGYILNPECGYIVDSVSEMTSVITNYDISWNHFSEFAIRRIKENFTWEAAANLIMNHLEIHKGEHHDN